MNENNHKTIFVLDHTQYFGTCGDSTIEIFGGKNAKPSQSLTIGKSLWTYAVETSVEYCRIVWDLFPTGKMVRFIVSDSNAHIVNTWSPATQSLTHVLNAMAMVGVPPDSAPQSNEYSVIHGLRAAVEAIAEPTDNQKELIQQNSGHKRIINNARVICITSARDNESMKSLEEIFHTAILLQKSLVTKDPNLLQIDNCHLVIINLYPSTLELMVSNRSAIDVSSILRSEVHSIKAVDLPLKLTHLILNHYDLASTTVTGIPMKEEQNASSSANYDVEIFHAKKAHTVIAGFEQILPTSLKQGFEYETVTLKWCTPRGCNSSDLQPCLAQYRVTPVDVTSRPSSCLINFLLNGRSVMLEMPRKTGGKLTSHLLSAHGGEIYIHTIQVTRSCLEDCPSIVEGPGGKVTDYRIPDFTPMMEMQQLVPVRSAPDRPLDQNLERARGKIYKQSNYWPIRYSNTVMFNMRDWSVIFRKLHKEVLDQEDVIELRHCILNIASYETRAHPLPPPLIGVRYFSSKGNKKEEQLRLLWTEIETLITQCGTSPGHKTILQCIRDCRASSGLSADKVELENAVRELDPKGESMHRSSVIRATTDSPLSPPAFGESASKRMKRTPNGPTRTLLDIVNAADKAIANKRIDFAGRLSTPVGQVATLYPNLGQKEATQTDPK